MPSSTCMKMGATAYLVREIATCVVAAVSIES